MPKITTRIVGGKEVSQTVHPWMAALVPKVQSPGEKIRPFCGATLINDRYVITAAHCLQTYGKEDFQVALGVHSFKDLRDAEFYPVEATFQEPRYKASDRHQRFDIALVKLASQVYFDDLTQPVCLPGRFSPTSNFPELKVMGWGRVSNQGERSDVLLETLVKEIPVSECQKLLGLKKITGAHICAGGAQQDSCVGDSGGPLTSKATTGNGRVYLVGVVSWGVACGHAKYPGVYTRVWSYADFINQSTPEGRFCANRRM